MVYYQRLFPVGCHFCTNLPFELNRDVVNFSIADIFQVPYLCVANADIALIFLISDSFHGNFYGLGCHISNVEKESLPPKRICAMLVRICNACTTDKSYKQQVIL